MFKSTSRNRQSAGYLSQQKHLMLKKSLIKYLKHHSNRYYSFFRIGFLSNRKMLFTINAYITHTIRQDVENIFFKKNQIFLHHHHLQQKIDINDIGLDV